MTNTTFSQIKTGAWFYDYYYSGMWMQKLTEETARFEDGLVALVSAAHLVQIN